MNIIDGIINTFTYIFGVTPDSYTPLHYSGTIHFIIWLALLTFILEGMIMMIFQYLFTTLDKYIPLNLLENLTKAINEAFLASSYSFKYAELVKPFSVGLYALLYSLIISYTSVISIVNMLLKHFTSKELII